MIHPSAPVSSSDVRLAVTMGDACGVGPEIIARWWASESRPHAVVVGDPAVLARALDGRPGIHSARYPGKTYEDKFRNLYAELAPHRRPWTARFVCSLAFVVPDAAHPSPSAAEPAFTSEGTVEGEIAAEPRGAHGFGYDPIFFYPPYGLTLGQVETARKRIVSHRGAAFRQFAAWLGEGGEAAGRPQAGRGRGGR